MSTSLDHKKRVLAHQEAQQRLQAATTAIGTAVQVLKLELPTIDAFLKEARDMETFGHIVDPTLYRDSERRAVEAVVRPLFEAAQTFVDVYDAQVARSQAALKKVSGA